MGVAVGNLSMEEKQIQQNIQMSVNFPGFVAEEELTERDSPSVWLHLLDLLLNTSWLGCAVYFCRYGACTSRARWGSQS
jgi:hypothetical protein